MQETAPVFKSLSHSKAAHTREQGFGTFGVAES